MPMDGLLDEAPALVKLSLRSKTGPSYAGTSDVLLILLSLPLPLMPLLQFLYSPTKYSHIDLSHSSTTSPSVIFSKRSFSRLIVAMWNLFWCDFRLPNWVKCFPQSSSLHVYGFAAVCTILCARTFPCCAKVLPQMSQWYGRSPVCRR